MSLKRNKRIYALRQLDVAKMSRDEIKKLLAKCRGVLEVLSEEQRDDKELVMIAMKRDGLSLQFVSPRLKKDIDVVMAAINESPRSISYSDPIFYDNDDIRNYAFNLYGGVFIVNPEALEAFEYRDAKMIRATVEKTSDGCVKLDEDGNPVYDEEKLKRNSFYLEYKKYYKYNRFNPLTPVDIREIEEKLLNDKRLRGKYHQFGGIELN
jgi:hypothetical protein